MSTRASSLRDAPLVGRSCANPCPRTYVYVRTRLAAVTATLYSVRLERYPLPRASSRTSAPVTHRPSNSRTYSPLPVPPRLSVSFLRVSPGDRHFVPRPPVFTATSILLPPLLLLFYPLLLDRKASLLCISTRRIRYGTDRRRGVLCRVVLALIPADVYRR